MKDDGGQNRGEGGRRFSRPVAEVFIVTRAGGNLQRLQPLSHLRNTARIDRVVVFQLAAPFVRLAHLIFGLDAVIVVAAGLFGEGGGGGGTAGPTLQRRTHSQK